MTKIKICGLSRKRDIDYVNEAYPDYIGFVFAPSRRRITYEKAIGLKMMLDRHIQAVGVFADAPREEVLKFVDGGVIDIVQLHGNESVEYAESLKNYGCKVIKAISMQDKYVERELKLWEQTDVDFLLLDNGKGGTGEQFDHSLIGKRSKPFFLAGGITPENIEHFVREVHPYAVDLSSGVETQGLKSRKKIISAVQRLRQYE
ncbi:MAG: phosphoribosylanthranilate isomerase [Clostridia bacterium]|nr:phosphoribosylanthranilate isomerase [Clostridia bacterium]